MLWSLLKVLIFVALVAAGAWGAGWLLESEGGVRITVADTEFTLGPLVAVVALLGLVITIWLFLKLAGLIVAFLKFLNGDETAITRYFARNRERKGYDALAEGMMALASGDGRLALTKAEKADRYLSRPDLTTLLTAQAAEVSGDRKRAEAAYKKLLQDDRTRFVGVRGIMLQKLEEGDTDLALKLAEKAFALKPRHEDTQDVLLRLQAGAHDWTGARRTLGAKLRNGNLPRDVHKRRDAVLALGEARDIVDEGKSIEAREKAITANKLSPDLVPAAAMAADAYVKNGKPKYATRVIKKAWEVAPHPDLAAAFARIQPEETPAERVKRFAVLTNMHRDQPETKMLEAELHIAAEDFPAARRALGTVNETDPTARSLTIMAAIERGSGADDVIVKGWLARALSAARDPQWVCENCQTVHGSWTPVCDNCEAFDTLSWRRPLEAASPTLTGAEMLPLIVGQIESAQSEPEPDEDDVSDAAPEEAADMSPKPESRPNDNASSEAAPPDYALIDGTVIEDDKAGKKDAS